MTPELALPSGTVTFLFTDVEGSTVLWEEQPDEMRLALERHDEILRSVIEGNGGYVFSTAGDSFAASFARAGDALTAAVVAQEALGAQVWPTAVPIQVRMGLHSGEAQERDGDYFGSAVNVAARIMSAGHGAQILVSEVSAGLVGDVGLVDLGQHRLKGVSQSTRLFQVGEAKFAPLRTGAQTVVLPSVLSSLVGRDDLLAVLVDRLADARLVTLVGPGGVGKTRLAVAAAERVAAHRDVTVFVDLAVVSDGTEVLPAVAGALNVATATLESLTLALAERPSLLVMDNCEHLIDAAADVIADLLRVSTSLTVLATSREGLAIDGEQLVAVPGLNTGGVDAASVVLFGQRARAVDPGFVVDATNEAAVDQLCAHLDGIPLAIELAAARVAVMSPSELVDRLGERFEVLGGGRRRRSRDRHQTLRDTVSWSHDLLDADEKEMFARLSVFAGSFDPSGAWAINPSRGELEVLDLLEALVEKSLVAVDRAGEASRFRYLETIRAYADEKLSTDDRVDAIALVSGVERGDRDVGVVDARVG